LSVFSFLNRLLDLTRFFKLRVLDKACLSIYICIYFLRKCRRDWKRRSMERRNLQKSCLASIHTEGRAANWTHVYVPERHIFSASDRNFDFNLFNSGLVSGSYTSVEPEHPLKFNRIVYIVRTNVYYWGFIFSRTSKRCIK